MSFLSRVAAQSSRVSRAQNFLRVPRFNANRVMRTDFATQFQQQLHVVECAGKREGEDSSSAGAQANKKRKVSISKEAHARVNKKVRFRKFFFYTLIKACRLNRLDYVEIMFRKLQQTGFKIDINLRIYSGDNILIVACKYSRLNIVNFLLQRSDINVNVPNNAKETPLFIAAGRGDLDIVNALLRRSDVDINLTNNDDYTPLHIACENNHVNVVNALLSKDEIDVNAFCHGYYLRTALYLACENNHLEVAKALLKRDGIDANKAEMEADTPLYYACKEGNLEIVRALLNAEGIDVNKTSHDSVHRDLWGDVEEIFPGDTPLYYACKEGNLEIVEALMNADGIDVGSSFKIACIRGNLEVVNFMLKRDNVDVEKQDESDGWTPFFWASKQKQWKVVIALLNSKRVDINKRDFQGYSALKWAKISGETDVVRVLIYAGCDVPDEHRLDSDVQFYVKRRSTYMAMYKERQYELAKMMNVPAVVAKHTASFGSSFVEFCLDMDNRADIDDILPRETRVANE